MGVIDWNEFNENFQYYDENIIREVIDIFIGEYDERFSKMQINLDEKDFSALAFNAHSLKSVIANYMAPKPFELTHRLEEMAKNNSKEGIVEVFTELKNSSQELVIELKEYLQKLK